VRLLAECSRRFRGELDLDREPVRRTGRHVNAIVAVARLPEVLDVPFGIDVVPQVAQIVEHSRDGVGITPLRRLDRKAHPIVDLCQEVRWLDASRFENLGELARQRCETLDAVLLVDDLRPVVTVEAVQRVRNRPQVLQHPVGNGLSLLDRGLKRRLVLRRQAFQDLALGRLGFRFLDVGRWCGVLLCRRLR
jgi:hypothetical protein